jgi:hypothetical protein
MGLVFITVRLLSAPLRELDPESEAGGGALGKHASMGPDRDKITLVASGWASFGGGPLSRNG